MRSDAAELRASHVAEQRRLEAEAVEREQSLNTARHVAEQRRLEAEALEREQSLNTARDTAPERSPALAKPQGQVTRAQAQAGPQAIPQARRHEQHKRHRLW